MDRKIVVPHPIQILDGNVFPLKGTNGKATHLMTLGKGFKEYMFFTVDVPGKGIQFFLEECTSGRLQVVHEQEEWEELCAFARRHGAGKTQGIG